MAYDVNVDYKAKKTELEKQLAAATDEATKAALQAQIDANDVSRTQKIASDLTTYGKYATDSELNSAAGIMATNQIGTGYETQKANLNTAYDNAKINANNDALSRGMARSSFVSDRQANLDSQRATALQGVDAAKALAIQNATANILSDYRAGVKQDAQIAKQDLANQKTEFANTIGAYYNDYQAKINEVSGDNDPTNDWQIPYLQQARNEKIIAQQKEAAKTAKTSGYSGGGSSGKTKSSTDDGKTETAKTVDYNSPYGIITDIQDSRQQGYTNEQIKASAKAALDAGQITPSQYQMYLQYIGR